MFPKKILFIDDDPDVLEIIPIILEKENIVVKTSRDISVLPEIAKLQPDLILLDEWLPEKKGSCICAELKANVSTAHIPVILISAVSELEYIAKECNADAFISKPFDIYHLISKIQHFVNLT
jgi:two-component system response regulator VicR